MENIDWEQLIVGTLIIGASLTSVIHPENHHHEHKVLLVSTLIVGASLTSHLTLDPYSHIEWYKNVALLDQSLKRTKIWKE